MVRYCTVVRHHEIDTSYMDMVSSYAQNLASIAKFINYQDEDHFSQRQPSYPKEPYMFLTISL